MPNDLQVPQSTLQTPLEKSSPLRGAASRSLSFKEKPEPYDSSDRHQMKRKASVDFDSLPQLSVLPLGDQMLAALNADDIIPEKVFLISIKDSIGQVNVKLFVFVKAIRIHVFCDMTGGETVSKKDRPPHQTVVGWYRRSSKERKVRIMKSFNCSKLENENTKY